MQHSTITDNPSPSGPEDELATAVAEYQLTSEWRASSNIEERRFVLRTPSGDIENNLTATTLAGGTKISVPPFVFVDRAQASVSAFYYLGSGLAGYRGTLHGGVLSVILDECMGLASFIVLPNHIGVTASLEISYQAPVQLPGIVVIKVTVEKLEGRKAWTVASVGSPNGETTYAKGKALFIEPRGAEGLNQLI